MQQRREEWFSALGFFFLVLVIGGVGIHFWPRLLEKASGPENDVVEVLKKTESDGLLLSPGKMKSKHHHYDRITVSLDPEKGLAHAVATLDFEGQMANGTKVSSLGLEDVPFTFRDGRWVPQTSFAPRLSAAVATLEERRKSREKDNHRVLVKVWLLRLERDEVLVTEESREVATLSDRPLDELRTERLRLLTCEDHFCVPQEPGADPKSLSGAGAGRLR